MVSLEQETPYKQMCDVIFFPKDKVAKKWQTFLSLLKIIFKSPQEVLGDIKLTQKINFCPLLRCTD